jgi:hypothetical protein
MDEPMQGYDPLDLVKPRRIDPNPRCHECKSDDPGGRAPMFHPAHSSGPCDVKMPGGELCPHQEPSATPPALME